MITHGANTAQRRRNWRVLRNGWNNKFQRSGSAGRSDAFPAIWKRTWPILVDELPREACGVRPACWRCRKVWGEKREQAPRTPHVSRSPVAALPRCVSALMLKPTPATAFGLRPSSGLRISDFSCRAAAPRQRRAPVNGATTACQRCCYGAALYWSSIGSLLVLYCSSTDGGFLPRSEEHTSEL